MPSAGETHNPPLRPSVFLSYASEDRPAASLIRDALAAAGLEVWFDEEVLAGGDAWDRKIRRQIRDCDYFMPVISAQTEGRHEGYFRREWRLAVERTLDMADDHTFLLPVAIDATDQASARVPEKFLAVQWLKLPGGQPTPALEALCSRLIAGEPTEMLGAHRRTRARPRSEGRPQPAPRVSPAFPTEEPGQRVKFWFGVAGWALRSAWVFFQRFPRWFRLIIYVWIAFLALSRGCSTGQRTQNSRTPPLRFYTAGFQSHTRAGSASARSRCRRWMSAEPLRAAARAIRATSSTAASRIAAVRGSSLSMLSRSRTVPLSGPRVILSPMRTLRRLRPRLNQGFRPSTKNRPFPRAPWHFPANHRSASTLVHPHPREPR